MTKFEAYRLLNDLYEDCPNDDFREALGIAMNLLESEDLLTEALEQGRLVFVQE